MVRYHLQMNGPDSHLCNLSVLDRSQFVQARRELGDIHRGHGMTVVSGVANPLLMRLRST
jgi:hypothetical protein